MGITHVEFRAWITQLYNQIFFLGDFLSRWFPFKKISFLEDMILFWEDFFKIFLQYFVFEKIFHQKDFLFPRSFSFKILRKFSFDRSSFNKIFFQKDILLRTFFFGKIFFQEDFLFKKDFLSRRFFFKKMFFQQGSL